EELGAKVFAFAWDDDFSAGRNFTIGQATGDWILWMNPDEEVLPPSYPLIRGCMAVASAFGHLVRLQHVDQADRPDRFTETRAPRLSRRRPDLAYLGRCHPEFPSRTVEAVQRDGLSVQLSQVVSRHHAYQSVVGPEKLQWAARLLERELGDRPG